MHSTTPVIIRNRQDVFITTYFPQLTGSYESAIANVKSAQRKGLIDETDERKMILTIETAKRSYEDGTPRLSIQQARNLLQKLSETD